MIQSQQQQHFWLKQHPVLVPLSLVSSACALVVVSFFADSLFPALKLIGTPSALVCLLLAWVLGICGVLTGIISSIEHFDRLRPATVRLPQAKEHCYDRD